jgi:GGDEF domain-containing protein
MNTVALDASVLSDIINIQPEATCQGLARAARWRGHVAVVNVDMDGLNAINDKRGHREGDAAICQVPSRISGERRVEDLAARIGGGESGFAPWPDAGRNMEPLIEPADQAMYRVKHARRPGAGALHG